MRAFTEIASWKRSNRPGPLHGRTCVPGFSDAAEPSRPHEIGRSVLLSAADGASALRILAVSTLNRPARTHRYRHFA